MQTCLLFLLGTSFSAPGTVSGEILHEPTDEESPN